MAKLFLCQKSLENYSAYCCSIMRYIIRGQIYLFASPVPGIGLSASQLPRITQNMSYTRKLPGTGNKEPLLRLRSCQCNKFRRNYAQALSHNLWPHARISAWVYLGDRTGQYYTHEFIYQTSLVYALRSRDVIIISFAGFCVRSNVQGQSLNEDCGFPEEEMVRQSHTIYA